MIQFAKIRAVALLAFALPFAAGAQAQRGIEFSRVVTVDTPKGKATQRFRELAEERSSGPAARRGSRVGAASLTSVYQSAGSNPP